MLNYGFIVEGLHDKELLEENFLNARATHCYGTRINNKTTDGINNLIKQCDKVFIFTDSDEQGDLFAKQLSEVYPNLKRLRLEPSDCELVLRNRKRYGVEFAKPSHIHNFMQQNGVNLLPI